MCVLLSCLHCLSFEHQSNRLHADGTICFCMQASSSFTTLLLLLSSPLLHWWCLTNSIIKWHHTRTHVNGVNRILSCVFTLCCWCCFSHHQQRVALVVCCWHLYCCLRAQCNAMQSTTTTNNKQQCSHIAHTCIIILLVCMQLHTRVVITSKTTVVGVDSYFSLITSSSSFSLSHCWFIDWLHLHCSPLLSHLISFSSPIIISSWSRGVD